MTAWIRIKPTVSEGPFRDEVDYMNPMGLAWEVNMDSGDGWRVEWENAGTTGHRTYVTLSVLAHGMRQETLFDIACRTADGETDPVVITERIWNEFSDREVRKVEPKPGTPTGPVMTYYGSYNCGNQMTETLLGHGDCQCTAWALLFLNAREVHRIESPGALKRVSPSAAMGFIVRNWAFTGAGTSGDAYFPYFGIPNEPFITPAAYDWRFSEVNDALGVEGQANSNPASLFGRHWMAKLNGKYYDPSYGRIWNSLPHFDDEAVAGYLNRGSPVQVSEAAVNLDLNGDGDKVDTVVHPATVIQMNPNGLDLTE